MPLRSVSTTALARIFSDFLNQARYQHIALGLKRRNEVIACVTPPSTLAGFPIERLDALLTSTRALSAQEGRDFLRDIHAATDRLVTGDSAWGS